MNEIMRTLRLPAFIYFLIVAIAIGNWMIDPDAAAKWIFVMVLFPVVVLSANFSSYKGSCTIQDREKLNRTLSLAGSILVVALSLKMVEITQLLSEQQIDWLMVYIIGGFFIFFGNNIPKAMIPLNAKHCSPAQYQSLQRFIGWGFVLIGIAYIGIHFILPMETAENFGRIILWTGLAILIIRTFIARHRSISR